MHKGYVSGMTELNTLLLMRFPLHVCQISTQTNYAN